jgi:hypothetical protein
LNEKLGNNENIEFKKTGTTIVNKNRHWGKATLIKNFKEKIEI